MAEMLQGKNKILLFRKLSEKDVENATKLAFQTEHTFTYSRGLDRIVTKDGIIVKVGELEAEVDIGAIQRKDDELRHMLRDAVISGEKLELWEVTVDEDLKNEEEKYPAVYCQGYLEEWEDEAGAEDEAAVSGNFIVELEPQFGYATLTEEQEQAVQYAFKDTLPDTEGDGGGGVEG